MPKNINRRAFIKSSTLAGVSILLAGCQKAINRTIKTVTSIPTLLSPTTISLSPTELPVALTAAPSQTPVYQAAVAIARQNNYDQTQLRNTLEQMFQSLGGITDIIKPGARVGIKVNLTGGTWWDGPDKPPATEYFVNHPAVAAALAEILLDMGVSKITVMDGLGDVTNFDQWGYTEMAQKMGIDLVDLCQPDPYPGFSLFPVGENYQVYPQFYLHPILNELDVFISLAKLKVHATAGVTLSMKNMIGIAPINAYRNRLSDNNRSAFHGDSRFDTRLPRVIIDLNRARPIHLAIIDGIRTAEGGTGPWDSNMSQITPGLLLAGKNPLALDAVASTVMGFDPQAPSGTTPFIGGENHLILASEAGLGTLKLSEIQVLGSSISEVMIPFKPVI